MSNTFFDIFIPEYSRRFFLFSISLTYHFFFLQWHRLNDLRVWKDAATQIFYSIGVGYGGMLAFSSYNHQKESIMKNTMIIAVVNSATSLFGSIAMFSILGYR